MRRRSFPAISRAIPVALVFIALFSIRFSQLDESRAGQSLQRRDAPNTLFGVVVFGGFRPLFLEYLWSRADTLAAEGRWWEVSEVFERIARLDPENERVWFNQGYLLTYNVAQFEIDDRERWRLYRQALRHVDAGLEANPNDWNLLRLRFDICLYQIARDSFVNRHARRNLGFDGIEGALASARRMTRAFPERRDGWEDLFFAAEEAAEREMNRGSLTVAADILDLVDEETDDAEATFRARGQDAGFAQGRITRAFWASALRSLDEVVDWSSLRREKKFPEAAEEPSRRLEALIDRIAAFAEASPGFEFDPEAERFDASAYSLIQFRAMELAQVALLAKMPAVALRLAEQVAKLARLPGGEIGPRMPYYTEAYVAAFQELADVDRVLRGASSEPSLAPEEIRSRFDASLEAVEALVVERAGRSDGWASRMRKSRLED